MDRFKQLVSRELRNPGAGKHPSADMLSSFAEQSLPGTERQQVLAHLGECAECREILFLAQPDHPELQPSLSYKPRFWGGLAFRWAAVAASVIVVAGGVFLTRSEFSNEQHEASGLNAHGTQPHAKISPADQAPAPDLLPDTANQAKAPTAPARESVRDRLASNTATTGHPKEKHMTAQMQPQLRFDNSDEVQVATGAPSVESDFSKSSAPAFVQNQAAAAPAGLVAGLDRDAAKSKDSGLVSGAATLSNASAISGSGVLKGVVVDPTGSVIPDAKVTVSGPAGAETVLTNQAGRFELNGLAKGIYDVKAQAFGFKVMETTDLAILDSKTPELRLKLEIAPSAGAFVVDSSPEPEKSELSAALIPAEVVPNDGSGVNSERGGKHATETRAKRSQMKVASMANVQLPQPQWRIAAGGNLQRSNDSGNTWQIVSVESKTGFLAVSSSGSEVWAGGKAGSLYHSSDSGQTWNQVKPSTGDETLQVDIVSINFSDPQNGAVKTSNGETWQTSDRGQTWRKQ